MMDQFEEFEESLEEFEEKSFHLFIEGFVSKIYRIFLVI